MEGGGARALRQFLPAMVHTIWHFAKDRKPLPERATAAKATRKIQARMNKRSKRFKYLGHELARPR